MRRGHDNGAAGQSFLWGVLVVLALLLHLLLPVEDPAQVGGALPAGGQGAAVRQSARG